MFRKMRRIKQQLSNEKSCEILNTQWRGVLSLLGDNDYPYGVPMNFYFDEKENKIYFHSAKQGHKTDSIKAHEKACFTVYDSGKQRDDHWSKDYNCVIAFGKIRILEDREKSYHYVRKLAEKYFPQKSEIDSEMNAHFARCDCLEFVIEHMTCKTVNES